MGAVSSADKRKTRLLSSGLYRRYRNLTDSAPEGVRRLAARSAGVSLPVGNFTPP